MTLCNKIFYCISLHNEIFIPKTSSVNIFGIVWSLTDNIRKFTYKFTYKCLSRFHRDKFKPKIYWQFTISQNIGMVYKRGQAMLFKLHTTKNVCSGSEDVTKFFSHSPRPHCCALGPTMELGEKAN